LSPSLSLSLSANVADKASGAMKRALVATSNDVATKPAASTTSKPGRERARINAAVASTMNAASTTSTARTRRANSICDTSATGSTDVNNSGVATAAMTATRPVG
jgi:hypothetical protein